MTTHLTTTLMPAHTPTTTNPTTFGSEREGVSTVAFVDPRRPRGAKRAWDQLSETDRQVLLREARLQLQRQAALQAQRDAHEASLYAMRSQR